MTISKWTRISVCLLLIPMIFAMAGCQAGTTAKQYKSQNVQKTQKTAQKPAQKTAQKPAQKTAPAHNALSREVRYEVLRVREVKDATVLVHNKDVVIGIDVKDGQNKALAAENVRYRIKNALPQYKVHVTSEKKHHTKIKTLSSQMASKHPVKTLSNDVGVLIKDIGKTVTAPFR